MRLFWIIIICQTLFSIALRGSRPIVSLYADVIGASTLFIGLLIASFAFLPMLVAIQAGKWLDYYGAKKMTIIGGTGMLISLALPVWIPTLPVLFINQLLIGISHVCVLISLQKTIGNLDGNRDKLIASFSIAGALGEFLGPLSTGFLYENAGFQWTFFIMALTVIAGVICIFFATITDQAKIVEKESHINNGTWRLLKEANLRNALIISGLVLYSKDLFIGYFPVYGNSIGLSPSEIGIVISMLSAIAVVIRFLQFILVQHFGRSMLMMVTLIISGIAFLFIPLTENFIILMLLSCLLGVGLGLGQPLSIVYTLNVSDPKRHGEVLGLRLTFNRGSQFIAPFIFGIIGQVGGMIAAFGVSGIFLLIGSYFTRMKDDDSSSSDSREGKK
ncbi:MFS transporter [Salirhabdus salicampi]|uniref:MFS transporter n=1 Tax=Salirhabdus salicampi TaxID=476102 RepID=UPI0020C3DB44|nr:MFS transporter [Salirhabdus salicampi]MCP8616325.1 MFS transporter [Salirhabdus salicampi]